MMRRKVIKVRVVARETLTHHVTLGFTDDAWREFKAADQHAQESIMRDRLDLALAEREEFASLHVIALDATGNPANPEDAVEF